MFAHAQDMLVCWQWRVNDDDVVVCVSDVREQDWGGRRQSTGPTPGEAEQYDNVELGVCVTATVFDNLVCWQCGVNDDDVVVCVSDVSEPRWGRRRESTGPSPGEAQQHDNVGLRGCVATIVLAQAQDMLVWRQ